MEYLERRKKLISKNPFTLGISFKGKSREQKYSDSVGPQTYQPVSKCTTPSYSFRYRPDDIRSETPGPGSYSIENRGGRFTSFSTSNRFETICQSVGPADYQVQEQAHLLRNNYKFSMGKSARSKYKYNDFNPGPGSYDINQGISKSMNHTIIFNSSFRKEKQTLNTPGPGSYNNNLDSLGKKGFKIPMAKLIGQRDQSPGPGEYNINKQKREKYRMIKFMKGKRDYQKILNSPGPGSYCNEINNFPRLSYSIGVKRRTRRKCQIPGPGTYF